MRSTEGAEQPTVLDAVAAAGLPDLAITMDSHERYAYGFAGKPLTIVRKALPSRTPLDPFQHDSSQARQQHHEISRSHGAAHYTVDSPLGGPVPITEGGPDPDPFFARRWQSAQEHEYVDCGTLPTGSEVGKAAERADDLACLHALVGEHLAEKRYAEWFRTPLSRRNYV